MLAVIVLLSAVTTAAMVSLLALHRTTAMAAACDAIEHCDAAARERARAEASAGALVYDLHGGAIHLAFTSGERGRTQMLAQLPDEVRVAEVLVAERSALGGQVTLTVAPDGATQTYAVRLAQSGRPARWIMFAGPSRQAWVTDDERSVRDAFEAIRSTAGDDAG